MTWVVEFHVSYLLQRVRVCFCGTRHELQGIHLGICHGGDPGSHAVAVSSLSIRSKQEAELTLYSPSASQPKQFRKMIQQTFQQYASLREEECVMKFFNTLAGFANIDQETYRCELIVMACSSYPQPA